MPFVEVNAVPHYYEFVGPHPQEQNSTGFPLPVVMTAGGQKPGEAMRDLANMLLEHGVEAGGDQANGVSFILWDRRNSEGRTGVKFDDELSIRYNGEPEGVRDWLPAREAARARKRAARGPDDDHYAGAPELYGRRRY